MLKLFLWLRYLRRKKIVFLSIAAVALSCALLIVIASLFSAFIQAVEKTGREIFGDIYLNPWVRIPESDRLLARIESLHNVRAATAVLDTYGLLHLGPGDVRAVHVLGIDPAKFAQVTDFKDSLLTQKHSPGDPCFALERSLDEPAGFVSIGILAEPDEKTDQYDFEQVKTWFSKDVVLTTGSTVQAATDSASPQPPPQFRHKVLKFKIVDIVFTGIYLFDSKTVYLPIDLVRRLTGADAPGHRGPHEVIQIKLAPDVDPTSMLAPVRKLWQTFAREHNLPDYAVTQPLLQTSAAMQQYFIVELRKQMGVLMLIFGIVCSAAVLLIFCIFYMIVITKQKDIAVIKSCGATSCSVASIFLGFGACIGVIGSALGTILGCIVTKNINTIEQCIRIMFGLKLWKSSVYMFSRIPSQLDLEAACWIVAFAVLAAAVGAFIPAIVAAKTRPVRILRYE